MDTPPLRHTHRIQALAMSRLGLATTPSVELSSFDQLPRRGDEAPLTDSPIRQANARAPAAQTAGSGF